MRTNRTVSGRESHCEYRSSAIRGLSFRANGETSGSCNNSGSRDTKSLGVSTSIAQNLSLISHTIGTETKRKLRRRMGKGKSQFSSVLSRPNDKQPMRLMPFLSTAKPYFSAPFERIQSTDYPRHYDPKDGTSDLRHTTVISDTLTLEFKQLIKN